jgi:hypothetical protein
MGRRVRIVCGSKLQDCNWGREATQKSPHTEKGNLRLTRSTAANTSEARVGMIACVFALFGFLLGLRFGHALFDALDNLLLGKTSILQVRDRGAAHGRAPLEPAMNDKVQCRIGEPDQMERDEISAERVQLIGLGDFQNLRFGIAGRSEAGHRISADERMLLFVGGRYQGHAAVVTKIGLLGLYELRDFGVRGIQLLELFKSAGPHARAVERTVVG